MSVTTAATIWVWLAKMTSDVSDAVGSCPIVAFTSPGGTGRTATLVNVACVLAAADKRVLILDQGVEAPWVHDYLWQFQAGMVQPGHLFHGDQAMALLGLAEDQDGLTARQYQLPMDSGDIDAIAFAGNSREPHHGRDAAIRSQFREAGYDYILIDIPADAPPATIESLAYEAYRKLSLKK